MRYNGKIPHHPRSTMSRRLILALVCALAAVGLAACYNPQPTCRTETYHVQVWPRFFEHPVWVPRQRQVCTYPTVPGRWN